MAFFFGDGFDLYSAITDCGTYWDTIFGTPVSLALSSTGRFAGSRGVANSATAVNPYITKTSSINDAVHHINVAIQQTATLTGTTPGIWIGLYDGTTAQCSIVFRSDGAILLTSGISSGTALATYAGAIAAQNTWYHFEIEVVVNSTTGSIAVRRNGNTSNDFFLGSLNTRASANNYANRIAIGSNWSVGGNHVIDDFLWRSDASSVPWIGDVRCYTRMPAADSAVQWSRSSNTVVVAPFTANASANTSVTVARFAPFNAPADGTISTVALNLGAADTGNMKCSIFASSAYSPPNTVPTAVPTTVLGSATTLSNLPTGSNVFTFGTPVTVARGTTYWLGFITDTVVTSGWSQNSSASYGLSQTTTYAAFPTANPTTGAALPLIITANITITTNAAAVGEPQQDAATTYVYSSTNGQADLYTIAPLTQTPTTIVGVTTRGYFQKSDAGTRNATVQVKSGSTTVQGTSTALPAGSWQWIARNDLTDPATGAAWTASGVAAVTIGPVVTA